MNASGSPGQDVAEGAYVYNSTSFVHSKLNNKWQDDPEHHRKPEAFNSDTSSPKSAGSRFNLAEIVRKARRNSSASHPRLLCRAVGREVRVMHPRLELRNSGPATGSYRSLTCCSGFQFRDDAVQRAFSERGILVLG